MSNPFDQFDGANASASNPFDQFDAPPANKKLNKGIAGDLVTDLKRGVEQLPSIVTGLADIPVAAITGKPLVGQAADTMGGITGFAPSKWAKEAEAEYSPGRVEAKRNVDQAWEDNKTPFADAAGGDFRGIGQIAKSYIQNPQQLVGSVVESLPSMVAGGAISKGLIATKTLGTGAGIMAGEGSIMAGQQMDKLSQTEADPRTAAAASAVTGIVGGGLGLVGGKVASKLGVIDPDVALATGTMRGVTDQAKDQTVKGMVKEGAKRVAGGAVSEGAFEELPQSVLEQVLSNLAQSKPWDEGVSRAAVEGTLAGALMGGAFNVIPPKQEKKADAPPAADTPEEKPMLALPAPTYTGTPGDQIIAADSERQAAIDKAQAESNAIWAARDEYERQQAEYRKRPMPTITNDPEPIQQRIDALMGINEARLQGFARTNYEKALENAFAEQIGFVSGKDSREIPFTMGDYLKSKVAAADIDRKGAARQPAPAGITAAPVIPVVGTLSAAANIAVQSGAHAATVANQQQASEGFKTGQTWRKGNQSYTIESVSPDGKAGKANFGKGESFAVHFDTEKANGWSAEQNSQAEAISTKPGKADTPTTGNREAAPQLGILAGIAAQAPSIAQSAPNTQPQGQGGMPATAQQVVPAATSPAGVEFDVSKRTNQQLEHLSQHGQPGWKEAAVAEIAKRGAAAPTANSASVPALKASDSAKAPEIPNGDGVTDKPGTAPSGVAPADDGGIKQAPEARKESRGLSVGAMPNTAESVTVKDGVVHIGKYPAQNFDTGEDVTVPAGATDQQIVAALKDAGAISPKHKVFGAEKEAQPAPEDTIGWTRMPTVEREALVARAGWAGKIRGMNLGGVRVATQAWDAMTEANRAKLVAASQNTVKNAAPTAATVPAETVAPNQEPIKKDEQPKNASDRLRSGEINVEQFMEATGLTDDDVGTFSSNGARNKADAQAKKESRYHAGIEKISAAIFEAERGLTQGSTAQSRRAYQANVAKYRQAQETLGVIAKHYEHPFKNTLLSKLPPFLESRFGKQWDGIEHGDSAKRAFHGDSYRKWVDLLIGAADNKNGTPISPAVSQPKTDAAPEAKQAKAQASKLKARNKIEPEKDSLFVAIAKAGGMDTDELLSNGIDSNDITFESAARVKKDGQLSKKRRMPLSFGFALPLHKKGGMSFDAMREAMQQYGYMPQGATKNDAIDLFRQELAGEPVFTPQAIELQQSQDQEEFDKMMQEEQDRIDVELAAQEIVEDETGFNDLSFDEQSLANDFAEFAFGENGKQDDNATRAGMRALGFTEEEINDELAKNSQSQRESEEIAGRPGQESGTDRNGNRAQDAQARERGGEEGVGTSEDKEFANQIRDAWSSQVSGSFTTGKEFPATVTVNGKTRRFSIWKDSGAGPIKMKTLVQSSNGDEFAFFKLNRDGIVEETGTKNLWALIDDVRKERIAEFDALFNGESFDLAGQTNTQAAEQFAQQQAAKEKEAADKKAADDKAKADAEANDFRLAGSDRAADVAIAGGQVGLFGANGQPTKSAEQSTASDSLASDAELERRILIAADSIDKLRKVDVERVLTQGNIDREAMAGYIKRKRPELAGEVDDVMADIEAKAAAQTNTASAGKKPKTDTAPEAMQDQAPVITLGEKKVGDILEMGNGNRYRIEGVKDGRISATRNPDQLNERLVLLGQEEFDRLVTDDAETRKENAEAAAKYRAEQAPKQPEVRNSQTANQPDQFAGNKLFTADKVAAARARLKSKLGTMNSGIDPELLIDGMTVAGAYIESGVRKFGDYAKAMVADLGEGVKPYLLSFYEAARAYPGLNKLGMDTQEAAAAQHQALLTPEVKAAAKEVIGESPKVEKKKPANLGEAVRLKADWGVEHIDGYTKSKTLANEDTDYGLKGGIKDEFLADAKRYLSAVAKALEAKGYTVKADRKGKPGKAVSVNEAGPAVSGDVYLRMSNGEFDVFAQVGETAVRGMGPEHPQGVSLMVRAGPSSDNFSPNNWMDTSLSAGDLVSWFEKRRQAYEQRGATQPVKEPEANELPDLMTEAGKFTVAKEIADYLIGGDGFKTIIEARKKISSIIGKPIEAATELAKQADEAIETAVVMAGREIVKAGRAQNRSNVVIYDRLVDLYRRQPNLAVRSSTSVRDQAYSTPVPLAYLASELAGITYETSVYEPTAGNGMLLVGAAADNVVANELNPKRAAMIRALMPEANVRENNGAEWRPDAKVDAVIANPPFGAVKDGNGETVYFSITPEYDTRELDHAIVFKALESLKDNGRAVLIVGGVQSEAEEARREDYRGKNKRQFYFNLYNNFNVIDHFTADGDLYSKQGASYPVDVIVINGRGKSNRDLPAADLPKIIKSYEELKEKLNVANRMEPAGSDTARTGRSNDQGRGGDAQGLAGNPVGSSQQNGDGGRQRSDSAGVSNAGRSDNEQSAGGRPVSSGGQLESSGTSDGGNGNRVSDKGRAGRSDAGRNAQGNRSNDLGGTSVVDGQRVESGLTDRRGQEQETGHQVSYSPHSNAPAVGTLVPRAMRDAIASSLSKISDQVGDIDNYVAESLDMDPETVRSNFSAEQIDALALSIRNAEAGKGFIIGDQTGIGKGRVVAAMIRYALVNGKTPIFVTEKPNLYSDMIRDLDDIGMTDELGLDTKSPRILITNGGESIPYTLLRNVNGEVVENNLTLRAPKAGKALDDLMQSMVNGDDLGDYKVIFTTYSQLQTVKGKQTTRQRFVSHFGASNYMIFDESHNAGGAGETQARTKEQRQAAKDGQSLVTGRAAFVRGLVQKAFGTFFSSATYAKRPDVMDLYSSTNMKLAVDRISQLGDAIKSGGVPMQQVVANMLTQDGQYIRRERTFAGVDYNTKETVVDQQTAENMASAMRSILAFSRAKEGVIKQMQKEFDKQGAMLAAVGGESTSVQGANFGSIMHNLIDQMLLSLKAKSSVDHAIERLKAGEKVVMTVSNTMGSFLKDYADEFGVMAGDPVALSFSDLYVRYLEKQRIVSIKAGNGEKRQHRLTDAELGPTLVDLFNKVRKQIDESGFGSAPISPIDYMHAELRKAGYKTDEITGRTITLNYHGETPVLASRSANIKQRVGAVSSFNNGDTDVLILNQAGSTGLSLHASSKFKDKRKRHMIIVQAEKNIDTHMQMLGRVHRTGQVIAPAYSQMMADIPAEMRPASVLLKKMASLNANTTASRKSSVTAEGVVDFMNDYGGQVVHEYLRDNPDVLEAVGGPDVMKLTEDSEDGNEDDIRKFTGYVPILPIKMQEEIYRDLIDRYNDLIERENSLGTNKLEAKAVDLDAETLSAQPITEKKEEQSAFASPAVMEKVDVKRSVKPYSSEEVAAIVKERLGDKTAREIASEQKLELRDKASAFARERIAKMQADGADPIKVDMHKSQLNLIYSHTNSILDTYSIGDPVSIKDQNGQFLYGVVTDIQTNGKTANPAAGSAWKMTFAIANGDAKSITMNFSQLGSKYEVRAANIVDWYNIETQSAERVPLMSLFDKGATVRREKRWIITGNLLAGYSRLPGQIITYTKKDGTSAQGILMSRQFDFEKEMKNAPVLVKSGAEAVKLFNGIGNGASLGTKDRSLMITDRNGRYELTVPSSKKDGGTYFLDQGITDIVGDLYKRGSIMSANVYGDNMLGRLVNYLINDRQEVIVALAQPEKAKQILRGEQGPGNIAERQASLSAADKAIYGMVAEGKNTADILKFIASASRNPLNRQLAKLLLKTGIAPQVMASTAAGWKFNAGNDKKYAAAYNPNTDTISLFRPAAAERNFLHEAMHAATLRALGKKGMAAAQMRALFNHVKKSGMLKGMYGMSDVDEFIAEAFSNPKFQAALKQVSAAPVGGKPSSAWDWFIRVVRGILGLKQGQDNALSQALDIGIGVMRENMRLNESAGDVRYNAAPGKINQTDTEAFRKWFGDSKVVDANGDPLVVYHGTGATDINEFKVSERGTYGGGIYLTPDIRGANDYAIYRGAPSSTVYPVYAAIKNPASGSEAAQVASWKGEENAREELIRRGYDGVVDMRSGEIVAFYPSQVKSAIGNSGDFDGSNPDIRYNVADEGWSVAEPSKMDDVIYALQDKQIDMKRVVQSIMKTGKQIKDDFNAYLQEELFHGRAAKGVKDFLDFELRPLLAEMQKAGIDMGDFEEYLWNRHAPERNAQIAKINPDMPDGGSGIETAKARAYLAGLSAEQRKTFEALAAKVGAMNRESQRVLIESGLEKQSTIDAWNNAYQHYVPLQREDVDSGHVGTGKGFSVRGSSTKRAMGSGRQVVDIIANLTMQRERNIVRAEKNRVSNALLGLAVQNPNPEFWKVDQAPKERVVEETAIYTVRDEAGKKLEEFTRMDEADRFARQHPGSDIDQTWGDRVKERVTPGFTSRDNVLLTRINGEDHYVIFNERDERAMRMAAAMKNLDVDNLGRVLSLVGKATRWLASINTQYNPVFGVINLIRDAQGALINLSSTPLAGEQKRVLGYTKDALVGIYKDIRAHRAGGKPSSKWAALFEEFQKEGGQTGYRDQYANAEARAEAIKSELEQFKEGKAKQFTRGLFGWLSDYNETMENAVRLAAYKAAKEKGMSNQQAASLAKNITVNFNRKGQMATQVGALYAFFNASVQGTARIAETLFEQHGGDIKNIRLSKKGKQIVLGGIMLGSMQALLLAAAGFDDDEPPEFIRERNLILPDFVFGSGKYLTLAMPLGLHVIPGIGRIATEFVLSGGKDPLKRIAAFGSMFADAFNPVGSAGWSLQTITPSVVDPFAALAENKDFTGKEIYREDFNKLNPTPGHARAKDVATIWSRYISEAMNFMTGGTEFKPGMFSPSPDSIDYLLGQLTGGVGREVNKAFQTGSAASTGEDLPLYKIPLVGRFVGDTEGQGGQSAKFYDAIKQINMHEAEYKGLLKSGRRQEASEYLAENPAVKLIMAGNHAESQVRKLRSMKRDLVDKDADKDQVSAIDERITATMRKFNERAGAAI